MYSQLKALNPHIDFYNVSDDAFKQYGKVIKNYNFTELISIMKDKEIPAEGNKYVACDPDLMQAKEVAKLSRIFYGNMPIQVGFCNGNSSKLNALEYHNGSEIDVAVTDMVLLLSDVRLIENNTLSSGTVKAFYVPAGTACELYGTTLHYAPCKVSDDGYKSIVVLPDSTNINLSEMPEPVDAEDFLLWRQNKWLIAHPESTPAANGAVAGITGENIEVFYK